MTSDITGFNIYLPNEGRLKFNQGPVMTNILLAVACSIGLQVLSTLFADFRV
ncbi:MAG: hypothetical protein GY729_14825 [Desulfobacteraceae bacterium]|nr:hypothetical protein [Desulfobacteraceae bacterium]